MRPGPGDLSQFGEIEAAFLEECFRHGAIRLEDLSEDRDGPAPSQCARLRRLQRICRSLDIDVFAGCIIVDLLDRMDALQQELERLRTIAEDVPADL